GGKSYVASNPGVIYYDTKSPSHARHPHHQNNFHNSFSLFIITCLTHMITFFKIKSIRNYVKQTKRLDINPLHSIKSEFESRQHTETITLETFIQEKFSDWRILQIPVV